MAEHHFFRMARPRKNDNVFQPFAHFLSDNFRYALVRPRLDAFADGDHGDRRRQARARFCSTPRIAFVGTASTVTDTPSSAAQRS